MAHRHKRVERIIHAHFVKGVSLRQREQLFSSLAKCPKCAAYFDHMQELEILMYDQKPPTEVQIERMEASLVSDSSPFFYGKRKWVFGVLVPTAAMMLLMLLLWPAPPSPLNAVSQRLSVDASLSEFTPKGTVVSEDANVGIRIFRVLNTGEGVAESSLLSLDDVITFTYTSVENTYRYLTIFGVQEEQVVWYYPTAGDDESISIQSDVVDEPLGHGFRMDSGHQKGTLRITALFSDSPVSKDVVESVALEARAGYKEFMSLPKLSLEGRVAEYTMGVTIE